VRWGEWGCSVGVPRQEGHLDHSSREAVWDGQTHSVVHLRLRSGIGAGRFGFGISLGYNPTPVILHGVITAEVSDSGF